MFVTFDRNIEGTRKRFSFYTVDTRSVVVESATQKQKKFKSEDAALNVNDSF
jgi:hypothetical protein